MQCFSSPSCVCQLFTLKLSRQISLYTQPMYSIVQRKVVEDEQREAVRRNISQDVQQIIIHRFRNSSSCNELYPRATSGYYWITNSSGNQVQVYCDASGERWGRSGGWFRIAYLNMTDQNQSCPSQWRYITTPKRTCGRVTGFGCDSVTYRLQLTWDTLQPSLWKACRLSIWFY